MVSDKPVTPTTGESTIADSHAQMEQSFIRAYLREKGYSLEDLHKLPLEEAKRLLTEASLYASARLTEIESRAQFSQELHDAWTATEHQ
jgi:hypothetical protein